MILLLVVIVALIVAPKFCGWIIVGVLGLLAAAILWNLLRENAAALYILVPLAVFGLIRMLATPEPTR